MLLVCFPSSLDLECLDLEWEESLLPQILDISKLNSKPKRLKKWSHGEHSGIEIRKKSQSHLDFIQMRHVCLTRFAKLTKGKAVIESMPIRCTPGVAES